MTIQPLFFNLMFNSGDSKFNLLNIPFSLILVGGCCYFLTPSAIGQNVPQINDIGEASAQSDRLPPPPPLSPYSQPIEGNRVTRGTKHEILRPNNIQAPPTYNSSNLEREYTFDAPNNESTVINIATYHVEVLGNSDRLLEQVRTIEPKAFLKGDIIQVGIFSDQDNAANLVRQLALQGLWARIVTK
ncbi:MAG: SPOR domain-containing protein [Xenococcaceae cyanobacterium MO_207.B15]|nr:SPOR domain-containing protein [Xenococcaceae cyanobacterium MO_207.B15]